MSPKAKIAASIAFHEWVILPVGAGVAACRTKAWDARRRTYVAPLHRHFKGHITNSNADCTAYSSTKPNVENTSELHLTGETLTGC